MRGRGRSAPSAGRIEPTRCVRSERVRKPWAIVPPNGDAFARSGSTWMNWWSWVAPAVVPD